MMTSMSESLKKQREQILRDMGEDALSRHTSLLEVAVISLYNRLVNLVDLDTEEFRAGAAVLTRATVGKGLMDPNEPVQLLLLTNGKLDWKPEWVQEFIGPLKDAGWVIDLDKGSMDDLRDRASKDFAFFLELLGARFLSGNRHLAEQLDDALEGMLDERRGECIDRLHQSFQERVKTLEETDSWFEPDLESHPGGLDDISAIRLACRVTSNMRELDDAIFNGCLNRHEVDYLQRAEKTFLRLLSMVRGIAGGGSGVLTFERQELLAEKLGYAPRAGFLPVEGLMQTVFQLFNGILFIARDFWECLREGFHSTEEGRFIQNVVEEGITLGNGKLYVHPDRYQATPSSLVHLFVVAARHGAAFAGVTRRWIEHHRNVLDTASGNVGVKEELLELICSDEPHLPMLRRFYDQGLMTSLIPELSAVHGLVQHDAFHLYPVHEHHLRTLSELKKIFAGHYDQEEPRVTRIAATVGDPVWMFLAALLHDLGKSSGRDHALRGGEMIPAIAGRLGLTSEERDTVQFLVMQHLLILNNASMRDLADEQMLSHCALMVGMPHRLDLLVLLSCADMRATGPKAVQKWKDAPVLALYDLVGQLLEKGEPSPEALAERVERVKHKVEKDLADLIGTQELEQYFSELSPRYLLSMPPETIAAHLRLGWKLQASQDVPFVWEVTSRDDLFELTLMSWEIPAWLVRTTGVLTLHNINIIGAQVFTMNNGLLLLIFQCRLPEGSKDGFDWQAVPRDLLRLLKGKMALDYRIAAHAVHPTENPLPFRSTLSQVLVDNESSDIYTILEVYALDRVGLLYTISRTLYDLQVRIYVAKITTKVDQAADVFYIRTHEGEKVTDPDQIREIRKALCFRLDGPSDEL